jgi:hypothetical protein
MLFYSRRKLCKKLYIFWRLITMYNFRALSSRYSCCVVSVTVGRKYEVRVASNDITLVLNFMKIRQFVSRKWNTQDTETRVVMLQASFWFPRRRNIIKMNLLLCWNKYYTLKTFFVVKHHAVKAYWGSRDIAPRINLCSRCGWVKLSLCFL